MRKFKTVDGSAMKQLALTALGLTIAVGAFGAETPSEKLLDSALADHFTRYFCVTRFPDRQRAIQSAYDSSLLRFIAIPCRGLKCSTNEHTEGMRALWLNAEQLSDDDANEVCASYADSVRGIEEKHAEELAMLFPWIKRK